MKIEVYGINDKKKLISWLESSELKFGYDQEELNDTIVRLKNEVEFFEAHNKGNALRLNGIDKELSVDKEKNELLDKLISTNYEKAFKFLEEYGSVDDETVAYSDLSTFNNDKSVKQNVSDLLDFLINYTHIRLNNISAVEFFNDEVDNWKYRGEEPSEYFFPQECFLYRFLGDTYIEYSEMHGQGTVSSVRLIKDLEEYGKSFGHSLEKTKRKIIVIE